MKNQMIKSHLGDRYYCQYFQGQLHYLEKKRVQRPRLGSIKEVLINLNLSKYSPFPIVLLFPSPQPDPSPFLLPLPELSFPAALALPSLLRLSRGDHKRSVMVFELDLSPLGTGAETTAVARAKIVRAAVERMVLKGLCQKDWLKTRIRKAK